MIKKATLYYLLLLLVVAGPAPAEKYEPPTALEKEHFIFYFDNPRYINEAEVVLNRTRAWLIELLRDSLSYKPSVYIVESQAYFNDLVSGRFPDWGAAAALPGQELIVIKSPDRFNLGRPLSELLAHEYAHLALHHRTGRFPPPRWFDEGMAMFVSSEWNWSDNLAMSRAAIFGQFLSLDDIEMLNRFGSGKAHVAYAQSYLAVNYLIKEYDITAVNIFLDEIARDGSLDSALILAVGSDYKGFQDEFYVYLTNRFNIASLFMDTIYLWIFLALVVVVGAILKFRKKKDYYKKWEGEERYQSTDFDYGDPDNPEQADDDEPWRS
ncbi:MAG: hypothetical protein JXA92_03710 [candidate division Zixibacteria bacterium]|nr:hypothetical protein [candidate division Zixibacteria bacterium]